jgi:sigma-B regulation protein RsbU (phosphoserine phosphatase)
MNRILLLMAHKENRHLLTDWLATHYQVALPEPEQATEVPFDLCIIDGPVLDRLKQWVHAVKKAEQPVFLPFLLVTNRQGVGMATRHLWESIDEVIISPVEKAELHARVEILLRARQLSLQNAALTRQLEAELARAGTVQAELLPREVPVLSGFELAARCVPAREVGGDFYDWQELAPGMATLTVGDVMGKGMSAALLMATIRSTLRAVARQNPPAVALELARQALETDFERTGSFATLFHAKLTVNNRRLLYVDAGHSHGFMRRVNGTTEQLTRGGKPLGIPSQQRYQEAAITFREGDILVVYSDGLLEARPQTSLNHLVLANRLRDATSAADMVEQLVDLAALTGPPPDDLTVVVLRCCNEHGGKSYVGRQQSSSPPSF